MAILFVSHAAAAAGFSVLPKVRDALSRGRTSDAERLLAPLAKRYKAGKLKTAAEHHELALILTELARLPHSKDRYHTANRLFFEAKQLDPTRAAVFADWGLLYLEKYDTAEAAKKFEAALAIDPKSIDAQAGLARVAYRNHDYATAAERVQKVLAAAPRHALALQTRVQIAIDEDEFELAVETLHLLSTSHPRALAVAALRAVIAFVTHDFKRYNAERARWQRLGYRIAQPMEILLDHLVKRFRYDEIERVTREALAVAPESAPVLVERGMNAMRLGNEALAIKTLDAAIRQDPFHQQLVATLNFVEKKLGDYRWHEDGTLRLRVHKTDEDVLVPLVTRFVKSIVSSMSRRFGYIPPQLTLELYKTHPEFSLRAVGVPNLGALGVCFGPVVTAVAPQREGRPVNWGQIYWHEMSHVFSIALSRGQVPRWFGEGLAVVEEGEGQKVWAREIAVDMARAIRGRRIVSVAKMNRVFTRARTQEEMLLGYHLSSRMVAFIKDRWGWDAVTRALVAFGEGLRTGAVVKRVTGLPVGEFDTEFLAWLKKSVSFLDGQIDVDPATYRDIAAIRAAATAAPRDAALQAALATALFVHGARREALAVAERAIALNQFERLARYVAGQASLALGQADAARKHFEAARADGADGSGLRLALGIVYKQLGDLARAEAELAKAKELNPEDGRPLEALAELFRARGETERAVGEQKQIVSFDQTNAKTLHALLEYAQSRRDPKGVIEAGEALLFLNPYGGDVHVALARAYREDGRTADAVQAFRIGVQLAKDKPADLRLDLAEALTDDAKKEEACAEVEAVLSADRDNPRAIELRGRVCDAAARSP